MSDDGLVNLVNVVGIWLSEHPKFRDHYRMTFHEAGGMRLDWIECKCKVTGHLPPTPKYDIIVLNDPPELEVWEHSVGDIDPLPVTDPEFFSKLEGYLDRSHY